MRIIPHSFTPNGDGNGQAFRHALVLEISWDFSAAAPVSAALPRTPTVEEMRTTDTHTVTEDSTKASAPRRHNHHILAEDTVPSAPIGDAGRCS